jgi:purine-binding chemotaxis protein CheW
MPATNRRGMTGTGPGTAMRRAADLGRRTEYLAFSLAGEAYAVQIAHIAEILKPLPITWVPRAPRNVVGVMSVRGRLVTVIDLRRRLSLRESPMDRRTRILLADLGAEGASSGGPHQPHQSEQIGLLVDEVMQVYRLAENEIEPATVLGGDQPAHIRGIGRPEGALLILLDLRPLLAS